MAKNKNTTSNAVNILHARYIKGDPKRHDSLREERQNADIATQIYNLRIQAGLSQRELAKKVGTTQSVISRLESADYNGHSLEMLRKIATAMYCRVEVQIVPNDAFYAYG